MTKYVVITENTLGYMIPGVFLRAGVLSAKIGGYYWKNGPVPVTEAEIRPATVKDFNDYRLHLPPDFT